MWPWQRWRADRDALLAAREAWHSAQEMRKDAEKQTRESRRLRERDGFGEAVVRAMGGRL